MVKNVDHPVFRLISDIATEKDWPVFVVGGWVRDQLLKRQSKDIDIVVVGNGIELATQVASAGGKEGSLTIFKNFGTARLRWGRFELEFVGARKESYRLDSRKPIVEDGTLQDDFSRRDFTINAMAISLNKDNYGTVVDPFNGLNDLQNKIIRTPLDPDITFSDDPLRMMRALRFSAQLGFSHDPEVFASIRRNSHRIEIVSVERIIDEFNKIMLTSQPGNALLMVHESGLLQHFFPELEALKGVEQNRGASHKDNLLHTFQVLDNLSKNSDNLWLRWAALLHDIAKPLTKKFQPDIGWTFHGHEFSGAKMIPQIFSRLKLPLNDRMKYVKKLVMLHMRPIVLTESIVTDSAIRRLLFDAGDDIDDLMLLCEADITSANPAKVKKFLKNFALVRKKLHSIEEKDRLRNWQPPVSGDDIMQIFGLKPCAKVGIIKSTIREAILEGIIPNERQAAMELMLEEGKKLGLIPVSFAN
ncbi:MAG TPA: HD domain-containing protein [Bacteroidales bacterium]|nr:HD domain-containing protein [Bacteroidales bacterium]